MTIMSAPLRPPQEEMPTVLVVDDDPDARDLLAFAFRRRGSHVVEAGTFAEAKEALAGVVDAIITDLELPDGSGLELLEGGARERVRVALVLSGHSGTPWVDRSRASGFDGHVTKPCDAIALVDRAYQLLAQNARAKP